MTSFISDAVVITVPIVAYLLVLIGASVVAVKFGLDIAHRNDR